MSAVVWKTTGDLSLYCGVDAAPRMLVCGVELTSSDSLQRVSTAHSCLSCQDKCQSWKGGLAGGWWFRPSLPSLSRQAQRSSCLPGGLCSVLLNWTMNPAYAPACGSSKALSKLFNVSLSRRLARLHMRTCRTLRKTYTEKLCNYSVKLPGCPCQSLWDLQEFRMIQAMIGVVLDLFRAYALPILVFFILLSKRPVRSSNDFSIIFAHYSCVLLIPHRIVAL